MITLSLLVRATYMYGVVLHAHPFCGESHNQHNTTGEVATVPYIVAAEPATIFLFETYLTRTCNVTVTHDNSTIGLVETY